VCVHRDVGTRGELEHYLRRWIDQRLDYLVLYLAFHGSESGICLSNEREGEVSLDALGAVLADELDDCVVHFGSCSVMAAPPRRERNPQARAHTTIGVPGVRVADDLVQRRFRPERPDVLWLAD